MRTFTAFIVMGCLIHYSACYADDESMRLALKEKGCYRGEASGSWVLEGTLIDLIPTVSYRCVHGLCSQEPSPYELVLADTKIVQTTIKNHIDPQFPIGMHGFATVTYDTCQGDSIPMEPSYIGKRLRVFVDKYSVSVMKYIQIEVLEPR